MNSDVLVLPPHLKPLVEWSVECLAPVMNLDSIWMGGGSVLAARWKHRHTTNIDLFFDELKCPSNTRDTVVAAVIQRLGDQAENSMAVYSDGLVCKTPFGPLSINGTDRLIDTEDSSQRENVGNLLTESSSEILLKKIRGRILNNREYSVRDLYDVVSAFLLDEVALLLALLELESGERQTLEYAVSRELIIGIEKKTLLKPKFKLLLDDEVLERLAGLILIGEVDQDTERELDAMLT